MESDKARRAVSRERRQYSPKSTFGPVEPDWAQKRIMMERQQHQVRDDLAKQMQETSEMEGQSARNELKVDRGNVSAVLAAAANQDLQESASKRDRE